jgi:hypothetical protein
MRWVVGVGVFLALLVVGAIVIGLAGRNLSQTNVIAPAPETSAGAPELPPPTDGSQWRYTSPQAATASQAGTEACTKSEAEIGIGGGAKSGATLCLRRGGGYPYAGSILLGAQHTGFVCGGCAVRARFDGGGAQGFDATDASSDGGGNALFITDGPRLAVALKHASTATFSVSIRGAGDQTLTFNVTGLRWE